MLEFLGFDAKYITEYLKIHTVVRETMKSQHKKPVPWRLADSGNAVEDCEAAIKVLLQDDFHYKPQVTATKNKFQVRVNDTDICSKSVEQVRDFCQSILAESTALNEIVEQVLNEGSSQQNISLCLELLLNYLLNDPLRHTSKLADFLDPHYFSLCATMEFAFEDG